VCSIRGEAGLAALSADLRAAGVRDLMGAVTAGVDERRPFPNMEFSFHFLEIRGNIPPCW
jgi:hypothetical protein